MPQVDTVVRNSAWRGVNEAGITKAKGALRIALVEIKEDCA